MMILKSTSFLERYKNDTWWTSRITRLWLITIKFDQIIVLKATSFLEGHKSNKRVTYRIIGPTPRLVSICLLPSPPAQDSLHKEKPALKLQSSTQTPLTQRPHHANSLSFPPPFCNTQYATPCCPFWLLRQCLFFLSRFSQ